MEKQKVAQTEVESVESRGSSAKSQSSKFSHKTEIFSPLFKLVFSTLKKFNIR